MAVRIGLCLSMWHYNKGTSKGQEGPLRQNAGVSYVCQWENGKKCIHRTSDDCVIVAYSEDELQSNPTKCHMISKDACNGDAMK